MNPFDRTLSKKIRRTALCGVLVGAGGALFAATPMAQAGELDARTLTVHFGELDLTRPAGVQVLHQRLQAAAARVCASSARDLEQRVTEKACIKRAVDDAVQHVDVPALTRLHFGTDMHLARIGEQRQ